MRLFLSLFLFYFVFVFSPAAIRFVCAGSNKSPLYCSLCISSIDEIERQIETTREDYGVQTKWRIDEKKKIPYRRTEYRILEIIEKEVLDNIKKYGICKEHDEKGKIRRHLCREDWRVGNYSKLLSYQEKELSEQYEEMIDEHQEELALLFHRSTPVLQIKQKFCVERSKACRRLPAFANNSTAAPNPNPPPPIPEAAAASSMPPAAAASDAAIKQANNNNNNNNNNAQNTESTTTEQPKKDEL